MLLASGFCFRLLASSFLLLLAIRFVAFLFSLELLEVLLKFLTGFSQFYLIGFVFLDGLFEFLLHLIEGGFLHGFSDKIVVRIIYFAVKEIHDVIAFRNADLFVTDRDIDAFVGQRFIVTRL